MTTFEEYVSEDVYLIQIPISISYNDTFDNGTSINKRDNVCNPVIENCSDPEDDWSSEKRQFNAFGFFAWCHAFNGFSILTFFPVAVTYS